LLPEELLPDELLEEDEEGLVPDELLDEELLLLLPPPNIVRSRFPVLLPELALLFLGAVYVLLL
jgi:hypothetical protein